MTEPEELQRLIQARQQIDQALLERHSKLMAVLFTDIVGSTSYYEAKGDIAGLARVKKHNELLFPCVERHGGRIVKTIGDAIMAVFENPASAIDCGVDMQRSLREGQKGENDPIRIRIGAHAGRVMVDEGDVYGDAVNTAARVEAAAGGDEVWVSQALWDLMPTGAPHRSLGEREMPLKGKAEPVTLIRVRCFDDDIVTGDASAEEIFLLELQLGTKGLRVSCIDGREERGTVKPVDDTGVGQEDLAAITRSLGALAHGGGEAGYLDELRRAGEELFTRALSQRVQERLQKTDQRFLRLHLDDDLVHLPWEIIFDGEKFLGERFAVGRIVAARAADLAPNQSAGGGIVVVSNPSGDLEHAEREGRSIAGLFEQQDIPVTHLAGATTKQAFLDAVRGARLLHFAGHARTNGDEPGLVFSDGSISLSELSEELKASAPGFVFLNSCFASTDRGWEESARGTGGFAAGLLTLGTEHYLSPAWAIDDDDAAYFALRFYESVVRGASYGEAVRAARQQMRAAGGKRPFSFASYVLYGEPRRALPGVHRSVQPARKVRSVSADNFPAVTAIPDVGGATVTATAATATAPAPVVHAPPSRAPLAIGAAAVAAIAGVAVVAIIAMRPDPGPPPTPAPAVAPTAPVEAAVKPPVEPPIKPASALRHEGPVRISVLPFKNASQSADLDFLREGLVEVVVTDFGQIEGIQLIERGQIDVDIEEIEFSQTKYVNPATRAALGKIEGAEVVVVGSFMKAGKRMRGAARFVDVESGEILNAVKVEQKGDDVFALQDKLAAKVRTAATDVKKRMRP
jgi:class 3 adenylate cyclase/TolB-like protein